MKRSSDVIYATLMEIFLFLCFVFLLFQASDKKQMQELTLTKSQEIAKLKGEMSLLKSDLDKLRPSNIDPYCSDVGYILEFTLIDPDTLSVVAKSAINGLTPGLQEELKLSDVKNKYSSFGKDFESRKCYFRVYLKAKPGIDSEYFIRARKILRNYFYPVS